MHKVKVWKTDPAYLTYAMPHDLDTKLKLQAFKILPDFIELHLCIKEHEPSFKTVRQARSLELKVGFRIIFKAAYPMYQQLAAIKCQQH